MPEITEEPQIRVEEVQPENVEATVTKLEDKESEVQIYDSAFYLCKFKIGEDIMQGKVSNKNRKQICATSECQCEPTDAKNKLTIDEA